MLISEEYFDFGRSLVIVSDSPNNDMSFLTEELHTAGRWPVLVLIATDKIKRKYVRRNTQEGNLHHTHTWSLSGLGRTYFTFPAATLMLVFR
jgi:hypothetical protein